MELCTLDRTGPTDICGASPLSACRDAWVAFSEAREAYIVAKHDSGSSWADIAGALATGPTHVERIYDSAHPRYAMNLYYIERNNEPGYDEYDSAVVAASTARNARNTCPCGSEFVPCSGPCSSWVTPENVVVRYLGLAKPDVAAGVVCSSFNAG